MPGGGSGGNKKGQSRNPDRITIWLIFECVDKRLLTFIMHIDCSVCKHPYGNRVIFAPYFFVAMLTVVAPVQGHNVSLDKVFFLKRLLQKDSIYCKGNYSQRNHQIIFEKVFLLYDFYLILNYLYKKIGRAHV